MSTRHFAFKHNTALFSIALALGGCAVGPDYKRPVIDVPPSYPDAAQTETTDAAAPTLRPDWWTLYNDERLNELVATALRNSADMHRAVARIEEAEALLAETGSALYPDVDLDASSARSRISTLNSQPLFAGQPVISTTNRLALSTSFELDFWGKLRRATESVRAQVLSSRYGRDVAALTLAGAVTQSYFALRSLDAQIVVSQQTLATRDDALGVVTSRVAGGLATALEQNQAEAARADAALQLRDIQRQRALVEHQLAVLTGTLDLKLPAGDVMNMPIPALPPPGLPSTLIERRPDVQQAEQVLVSANAQIGVARAAQFPTFSLTGSFGGQSKDLGDLLKAGARIWSIGVGASMPILDAGKYAARTRQAEARQRQSLADYEQAVRTAFKDVADALTNVELTTAAVADIETKAEAARNALRLARLRYDSGYGAYLDVLDAQRTANAAELQLVQNRQAQLTYSVDLMKALGGGWSREQAPVAQR